MGEYFRVEVPVNNTTGAVWQAMEVVGVVRGDQTADIVTTNTGFSFLARTPEN
jgi:hypothetical protein